MAQIVKNHGIYEDSENRIIIRRDMLKSKSKFFGTLAHELIHAKSGELDCSRGFENELTDCIGDLLSKQLKKE